MGRAATRAAPKSGAALRYERQRREATEALAAQAAQVRELRAAQAAPPPSAGEGVESASTPLSGAGEGGAVSAIGMPISEQNQQVEVVAEARVETTKTAKNMPEIMPAASAPGSYRIADLREGQCRFACTDFHARPAEHRFCGEPVAWKGGKPTSWCREHLPVVSGAPGRHPGGASVADIEAGRTSEGA